MDVEILILGLQTAFEGFSSSSSTSPVFTVICDIQLLLSSCTCDMIRQIPSHIHVCGPRYRRSLSIDIMSPHCSMSEFALFSLNFLTHLACTHPSPGWLTRACLLLPVYCYLCHSFSHPGPGGCPHPGHVYFYPFIVIFLIFIRTLAPEGSPGHSSVFPSSNFKLFLFLFLFLSLFIYYLL